MNENLSTSGGTPTRKLKSANASIENTTGEQPAEFTTPPTRSSPRMTAGADMLTDGTLINERYRVIRHIAGGGMGDVYEVFDNLSGERRAVKLMQSHLNGSHDARKRMLTESKVKNLRHENLVSTIDVDEWAEKGMLFIVMELAPGETLRNLMRRTFGTAQRLTVTEKLEIGRQICVGLAYAHQTTVHRDIKPENILVETLEDGEKRVRIADFGIARLINVTQQTTAGQSFGTLQYMAPEQQRDASAVDHRADIYSVGVVLYELLTGDLPVGHFPMPSESDGSIPGEVDGIIRRSLAGRPDGRYADMGMMLADVERVLRGLGKQAVSRPQSIPLDLKDVNLGKIAVELKERRLAQKVVPGLPAVPDKILALRGRIEDLTQAISDLENEIHPTLRDHQSILQQIQQQLEESERELATDPVQDDVTTRRRIERLIDSEGNINVGGLKNVSDGRYSVGCLATSANRLRNVALAQKALSCGREQYQNAISVEKRRLLDIKIDADKQLEQESRLDLEHLLASIGLRDIQQSSQEFPLVAWGRTSELIQQQNRYQWDEWTTLARAEEIWKRHADNRNHSRRISDLLNKPLPVCDVADLKLLSAIALQHPNDFSARCKEKHQRIVEHLVDREIGKSSRIMEVWETIVLTIERIPFYVIMPVYSLLSLFLGSSAVMVGRGSTENPTLFAIMFTAFFVIVHYFVIQICLDSEGEGATTVGKRYALRRKLLDAYRIRETV